MGTAISYILDNHYGDPEKYNNKIKEFLITLNVDVDAENFNLICKPTEDYCGISVRCYTVENFVTPIAKRPYKGYETIFQFKLIEMPGCCAYLISTSTFVGRNYTGKGVAQFLQELKYEMAKDASYPYLFATTRKNNDAENHILEKFGWKNIDEVVNTRTRNTILTWRREIK
jgi:hypothetical protein